MYSPAIIEAFDHAVAQQQKSPTSPRSSNGSAYRLSSASFQRRPSSPRDSLRSLRSSLSSLRHSNSTLTTASA